MATNMEQPDEQIAPIPMDKYDTSSPKSSCRRKLLLIGTCILHFVCLGVLFVSHQASRLPEGEFVLLVSQFHSIRLQPVMASNSQNEGSMGHSYVAIDISGCITYSRQNSQNPQ